MGLPVGFVNMILNGLSLMVLRYNLPKLQTLYRINATREKRRQALENAAASSVSSVGGTAGDVEEANSVIA